MIRPAAVDDAEAVCAIYNHYVAGTTATFEDVPVSVGVMKLRIAEVTASFPWLVAEEEDGLVGYAYAAKWKSRGAYRFSVEGTVYVRPGLFGKGIGTALYRELIDGLRTRGVHSVVGGISLPNEASVALHEKLGFVKVAEFREIGRKFDRWINVGYWQLIL